MKVPPPATADWREYPQNDSRLQPSVAARDAIRTGDHLTASEAYLLHAAFETGEAEKARALQAADICARLTLRDAIQEATATLKEVAMRQIDSARELDETLQKATNAVVTELRQATIRKVA